MSAPLNPPISQAIRAEARKREIAARRRSGRVALLFIAPALGLVALFLLFPVVFNLGLSFTRWQRFSGLDEFGGLMNYQRLFMVPYFSDVVINTAMWVIGAITLPLAFGLGLALLLRGVPGEGLFKSLFFLPRVLAPAAVGTIWFYVYAPDGVINSLAGAAVGQDIDYGWLFESHTITPAIIMTFVWQTLGINMVLLLLGMAAIPRDPIEAAHVDGASSWQIFRHIVWPLLLPTVFVVTILNVIAGFTAFDLIWVMANGYPAQRSLSLAVYMYYETFSNSRWAFGAAIAVMLSALVILVSWALTVMQSRVEERIR
ncbi:carbohydrate ABC transporter permease [Wenxinia saemankumensis]|uniref:Carbohydrate ABC transporter membrane protein 1, CUT1 family n=1 Tax=Wenxinia saemankumensis TaxID=1447782 RepID=A0A1M5ZXN4_9RHOB|nr:sugar ABC transporter permease [Wenxinia saemankumensis]SHI29037.1 carbohydrate ABC transporter membrane protein 1, CUT1 family [Wenxinia saemankumensis]